MATLYGVTSTGFVRKTMQVIRAELIAAWRATFGASLDLSDATIEGQIIAILAEREALIWQLAESVYNSADPDKAFGAALDALCMITGTARRDASRSSVTLTLTGTAGTAVTAASQVGSSSTESVFETSGGVTLVALAAWVASTSYAAGDRRSNAGRAYVCITAGISAGAGGPTTTASDITDGAAHWRYMGEGTATADVLSTATNTGPTVALSGDLTGIKTPVSGWDGAINLLDATLGNNRSSDQALRLLREAELATSEAGPVPAIQRRISRVPGVTSVTVFYNNSDYTDGDGMPPHSVEVMAQGGTDAEILAALHQCVSGGIATYASGAGAVTGIVTDSAGTEHTYRFTRPEDVPIYLAIDVEVDADTFPSDGADQIKTAVVDWGDEQPAGRDARLTAAAGQATSIEGVLGWVPGSTFIDDAPAPASTATVVINRRQRATYDTSRINVTATAVTP